MSAGSIPPQSVPNGEPTTTSGEPQTDSDDTNDGISFGLVFGCLFLYILGSTGFMKSGEADGLNVGFPPTWTQVQSFFWFAFGLIMHGAACFLIIRSNSPAQSTDRVQAAEQQLEASLAGGEENRQNEPEHERGGLTLALANLWSVTHARLGQYHGIALKQAKRSFRNAQFAMLMGFGLLATFTVMAIRAENTAASVAAATLGAISAALAGFVGRTFIRSQEASAAHLQRYFDQPLELSRYLAAERLLANSELNDDQRAEVLMTVLQAMVNGTGLTPPAAAPESPRPNRPRRLQRPRSST
ncbi:hypothetical protein ACFYNZ_01750 [Streptomyces kebangsaanensis]|uniref:Cyanobacterial TRADD-N associated 2 transmembrane domain-containing protein n=1 Tax=Streptomyces kebangsaanensis TaxID=864058 RepID=A0ABW6KK24_9ACTN